MMTTNQEYLDYLRKQDRIFYCETDKDREAVSMIGYPSITFGDVTAWTDNFDDMRDVFQDKDVFVMLSNTTESLNSARQIHEDLYGIADDIRFYIPDVTTVSGTVSSYLSNHREKDFDDLLDSKRVYLSDIDDILNHNKFDSQTNDKKTVSAAELMQMDLKPIEFIVEGFLPVGLNLFIGKPKTGKSWLSLDLCLSVASGKSFLGFPTNKVGCLYYALEDSLNRLKDRLIKVSDGEPIPDNFYMCTEVPNLDYGFIESVTENLKNHPDTKLIIVDAFAKIRGGLKGRESIYQYDYRESGRLQKFAKQHGVCLLLVHHTRKDIDLSDPISNANGTNGLIGAMDSVYTLIRDSNNGKHSAILSVNGRDIPQDDFQVRFDTNVFKWQMLESADNAEFEIFQGNNITKTILEIMAEQDTWRGTATGLIEESQKRETVIREKAYGVGRFLNKHREDFPMIGIDYEQISNGSGAKIHKFVRM